MATPETGGKLGGPSQGFFLPWDAARALDGRGGWLDGAESGQRQHHYLTRGAVYLIHCMYKGYNLR